MKVEYWKSKCLDDHDAYSIRAKTRRAVMLAIAGMEDRYTAPYKVCIPYEDGFDLVWQSQSEGGLWEDDNLQTETPYAAVA